MLILSTSFQKLKKAKTPYYNSSRGLSLIEMAVVLLVISILMGVSLSLVSNLALFSTSKGEANKIADSLVFARNASMKSNTILHFEFDLDKERYRAYTLDRTSEELKEDVLLEQVKLPASHSLLAIRSAVGNEIKEGKVTLRFLPSGLAEEIVIYMGPKKGNIEATIIYSRYKGKATVHKNRIEHQLEDDSWEETKLLD